MGVEVGENDVFAILYKICNNWPMMKHYGKIAMQIQSEVQFFTLKPLIFKLMEKNYSVDIIVDDFSTDGLGYNEIAKSAKKMLKKSGLDYMDFKEAHDNHYDVCLMPYMDKRIKADYYLKYEYGTLNIKPSLTYLPSLLDGFHGFLCQSTVTLELLKVYGATFPVDNLRFYKKISTTKSGDSEKKRLLFAPTYNDQDEIEELKRIIKILKTKYYVVIKGHHGTSFLKGNTKKREVFEEMADEYYDSTKSLSDLIVEADVCLFDNSSAIGEALYAKVPCAIYAKDLDYFGLGDIHTTQYQLVKRKIIPWTNKGDDLIKIVENAMSYEFRLKQSKASDELFPRSFKTGVDGYIDAIEFFLNNSLAKDYALLHDYVVNERNNSDDYCKEKSRNDFLEHENKILKEKNVELQHERTIMNEKINKMESIIEDNNKKKLYKLADKLYRLEGRLLNVKG